MLSNDKAKEYPCVCGKVFRRQLALERHVDVHHSSKSVSHKCEVCGRTFGSRNTLTMHRTVHADSTPLQGSPYLEEGVASNPLTGSESPAERDTEMPHAGQEFDEMDFPDEYVQVSVSQEDDDDESDVMIQCRTLETEDPDPLTCRTFQLSEGELTPCIQSNDSFLSEFASANLELDRPSADCAPTSTAVTFQNQSLSSGVFASNDGTDQTMDFSDMVVEEIVSESLFQTADQMPRSFAVIQWSESSDQYSALEATADVLASNEKLEAEYQNVDVAESAAPIATHASELPLKRINKVKPETRKSQEKSRQSRCSEETRVEVEIAEEFKRDSSPKELVGLSSRQPPANRTPFICGICHKNFDSEKYLSMHMPLHKPYLDSIDVKIAVLTTGLEIPEVSALQGQPGGVKQKRVVATEMQHWTCQYCNKLFMQNSNYKNHMRTHSDERPFVCEICNIGFKERYHLKKHVLFKHTTDLKEKCRVCGKCFKDSTAVRAHERIHSEIRPYSCPLCKKTFKTSECLWHHENRSKTCGKSVVRRADALPTAASAVLPDVGPQRRARKPRQGGGGASKIRTPRRSSGTSGLSENCSTRQNIDEKFEDELSILNSETEASVMAIKAEPDCDLFDPSLQTFFSSDQELENILEILEIGLTNKEGSFAEETGSELTDSDSGLLTKDSEEFGAKCKGLECTKCVKKFSSTTTFEKHMVMHNEERPYRCTLCDNGFKLKVHLKKHHLYRHSNEYPCECSICGKRFKDSSAVRLHEKIHSSDRPFRCHCGKGFKTRENLWGHRNRGPCEKAQDFIANNISVFRTTEFGPILGVPITNGQGVVVSSHMSATPTITSSSFINTAGRTLSISQLPQAHCNVQSPVLLRTAHGSINVPHSVQFVPSCVISAPELSVGQTSRPLKVATLKFIKSRSNDNASTHQTSVLPTAIVTPLLRDGTTPSANALRNNQPLSKSAVKTTAVNTLVSKATLPLQPNSTSVDSSSNLSSRHIVSRIFSETVASSAKTLIKTSAADTVRAISAAAKCPTVQKFLEMGSVTSSKPLATSNQLLGIPVNRFCGDDVNIPPPKRRKLNSTGDDNSSTEGEGKPSRTRHGDDAESIRIMDQESEDSKSLPYTDPLLTNSPTSSSQLSIYPGMDDYDDTKYDPNDPTLNIDDVYWGDSDNTLSSGWLLENENLFSDLSLTSIFGVL